MYKSVLGLLLVLIVSLGNVKPQLTAKEIIKKSEEKLRGGNKAFTEMKINIIRPTWHREILLKTWAPGTDYSMILITAPKRDKGQTFLKNKKQVWSFIPKFNRITKLPPAAMSQSWMGTDLSNDDLVRESNKVEEFVYNLKKDTTINGFPCYHVELIPNEGTDIIWGKIELYIDKVDFITLRNEMYDEDDVLVNVLKGSEIKMMSGIKIATKLEMIPADKPGSKTIMTILKLNTKVDLDLNFFSKQNMKRVN